MHDAPKPIVADLVVSVNKTHSERIQAYLVKYYNAQTSVEESINGDKGKCGSTPDQIFVYVSINRIAAETTTAKLTFDFIQQLRNDPTLKRVIHRVFVVSEWSTRVVDVAKHVANHSNATGTCRVICHPKKLEKTVKDALPETFSFESVSPSFIVFVFTGMNGLYGSGVLYVANEALGSRLVCYGVGSGADVVGPSKAYQKLKEVFYRMKVVLPPDATALDIGASPGGWSKFLATVCNRVEAVGKRFLKHIGGL